MRSVRAGAERTAQIVAGLKAFSRPQVGKVEETDLIAGLETTLHLLQPLLRDRVTVHRQYAPIPRVRCRGGQVQQVFMNLLTNAAQAAGPGGEIFLTRGARGQRRARQRARHRGRACRPSCRRKIFDPFFTTKDVGEGTGLGLAISQRIVRSHGGRIELGPPERGRGAEFIVWLPLDAAGRSAKESRRSRRLLARTRPRLTLHCDPWFQLGSARSQQHDSPRTWRAFGSPWPPPPGVAMVSDRRRARRR